MKVLSFAAVGFHGREWWTRIAAVSVCGAAVFGQAASSPDLVADLAGRIAEAIAPARSIVLRTDDRDPRLESALAAAMRARGVTVADALENAPLVRASCGANLRERLCVAEIMKNGEAMTVGVAGPRAASARTADAPALELRPLIALREQILDVAVLGDEMLVLHPSGVSLLARNAVLNPAAPTAATAPIPIHRWPRDLRGRIRSTAAGFDVFLPGVTCRGRVRPLSIACSDENETWPIAIANDGIAATRNYFLTPEGFAFYGAASIAQNGRPRWLAVDRAGMLTFLDDRRGVAGRAGVADDVVGLEGRCGSGTYVAAASRAEAPPGSDIATDDVKLFSVDDDRVSFVSRVLLSGMETALWPGTADSATLVVRNAGSSRYEAFHVSLSCAR